MLCRAVTRAFLPGNTALYGDLYGREITIQIPYKAVFSRRNARVTARHNIQYAAEGISRVCMAVSTDHDASSALQSLYVGPLLKRFSRRIWKKTPERTKILKLYGEANTIFW